MKIEIDTTEQDGFVLYVLFRLENGLVLKSHHMSLPFVGKAKREEISKQINELITVLEDKGFEVTNKNKIAEMENF